MSIVIYRNPEGSFTISELDHKTLEDRLNEGFYPPDVQFVDQISYGVSSMLPRKSMLILDAKIIKPRTVTTTSYVID